MFNRVVDWAVQNRLLVLIALAVLIATAAFQIPKLNLDAFPDVTNVQVAVNTEAPGLAAEEVEQLITYPIEAVMYALPDVEEVRSISKPGCLVSPWSLKRARISISRANWFSSGCRPRGS